MCRRLYRLLVKRRENAVFCQFLLKPLQIEAAYFHVPTLEKRGVSLRKGKNEQPNHMQKKKS